MRPQLAVAAVLAAVGFVAGGYFLWPKPRHVANACAPGYASVPAAARALLASYAGRIRHDVQRTPPDLRQETWDDPLTGRSRTVDLRSGHVFAELAGTDIVAGRQALRLRQRPGPFQVETWVDPVTYVTLQTRISTHGPSSTMVESWLPRNRESVAATRIVVPAGFRHAAMRGYAGGFTEVSASRCAS